jgi:hypothetical protein
MATLYVTEFASVNTFAGKAAQVADQPPLAEQTVTYTTTVASSAFHAGTEYVRIHTDAICSISFGTAPTATTAKMRMVAGQTEYFAVPKGASYKVAAVTNT